MEIYGYAPWGYEGDLVRVEIDLRRGSIPGMEIVGLPGGAVREARERIRIALVRAGFRFPHDRILINLSPADLPKTGSGYDLPMALAILEASGQWASSLSKVLALGELALDGSLRRVPGVLAAVQRAADIGIEAVAVPQECQAEALCSGLLPVASGASIDRLVGALAHPGLDAPRPWQSQDTTPSWALVGQPAVVEALEVASAGGHSLLLYGPPGAGKTLAARSLETLLTPLDPQASLETSRLWSLAGRLGRDEGLLSQRPFRAPHHQATAEGLLGGGPHLSPGEVSLAHHGVLFLDEAPEFSPRVLQALREPLEAGSLTVVRAGRSAWFPSRFQLVMTANACPCGQTGRDQGLCFCSAREIRRYWDRIGTALMDRVDLRVFVTPEAPEVLLATQPSNPQNSRQRIHRAQVRQRARQGNGRLNHVLEVSELQRGDWISEAARRRAAEVGQKLGWSSRGLHSLLRVSRTVADLEDCEQVEPSHVDGAIALRKPRGVEYWES